MPNKNGKHSKNNCKSRDSRNFDKGFRRDNSGKSTEQDTRRNDFTGKYANDPAWHVLNPQLLKDFGKLTTLQPAGTGITFASFQGGGELLKAQAKIPGIMSINLLPSGGIGTTTEAHGLALAAQNLYSEVRHANSGSANYNAQDLMMYILAMGNIIMYYTWLCRLWGVLATWSQTNWYKPKGIVEAMGVDYDNIVDNLPDFKRWLDWLPSQINQRVVPAKLDFIKYWVERMSKIYLDDENPEKAQLYMYNPEVLYTYSGYSGNKGGALLPTWVRGCNRANGYVLRDFDTIKGLMSQMLRGVVNDEDCGLMMGDMLKAYGTEAMVRVNTVADDLQIVPVYDIIELRTIQNTRFAGYFIDDAAMADDEYSIYQDPRPLTQIVEGGAITFNPRFAQGNVIGGSANYIINFGEEPSPEMIVEVLRNAPHPNILDLGSSAVPGIGTTSHLLTNYDEIPSLLPINADVYLRQPNDQFYKVTLFNNYRSLCPATSEYKDYDAYRSLVYDLIRVFNFSPLIVTGDAGITKVISDEGFSVGTEYPLALVYAICDAVGGFIFSNDLENWSVQSKNYFDTYFQTSIMGEFNVMA